jgi:hypothetical protein
LLVYRFADPNDLKLATKALEDNLDSYWPHFEIRDNALFISSRIDPRKGISIPLRKETALKSLDSIHSLTLS